VKNHSLIGRKLGNYQIKHLLGHGGMADVYYGWDEKLRRPVAIKVFESETRAKTAQASRFVQEARTMAQWRHNNIVQIYSAGDETGLFYYVMEFVDGYDLASIMSVYADKDELMPIADVLRIGESLASALDYAHTQGVIHRDVKPANVMIANEDGRVVLGDFGLALDLSNKSQGEVFGSPHYIAPEQARRSSDAVPQSDLYSLGVILYEMLTGMTPFNDPSPATLALQHITETPPLPRSINPALTESVEVVLLKALEKSPADRYQSGKVLMEALNKALAEKQTRLPVEGVTLPPIPVNAPTIQRSDISLNSFTKRQDVVKALEERSTTIRHGLKDEDLTSAPKRRLGWVLFFVLISLLVLGWYFRLDLLATGTSWFAQSSTIVTSDTALSTLVVMDSPTSSPSPVPSLTSTVLLPTLTATFTASPQPTITHTHTPTVIPSATLTTLPTSTVLPTTSALNSAGYLMAAYYNQNSFYLHDKGEASRSVSGFTFERVSIDGTFPNRFEGWMWQKYFDVIQPNRCISLEILGTTVPYLNPAECDKRTLSKLDLPDESNQIFWTPNETSREFRVLWLNVEIARCQIDAGICDFYVP